MPTIKCQEKQYYLLARIVIKRAIFCNEESTIIFILQHFVVVSQFTQLNTDKQFKKRTTKSS